MDAPTSAAAAGSALARRLTSLDALRGFDMLWIMGGDSLGRALSEWRAADEGLAHAVAEQLHHAPWEGFRFYDLIFPLFLFIVGVSSVYSLTRIVERDGTRGAVGRILRRALVLWILGVLYYGGWSRGIEYVRLLGVLQRIALCYLAAGLAFVWLPTRALIALSAALLIGYWALLSFVPAPGEPGVSFAEGHNLAHWIDARFLPFRKWYGTWDPEGLLSTVPAVATCLLGVLAGLWLRRPDVPARRKALGLAGAGVAGILAGSLWGLELPVIKKLWTSSYVLLAGGWSALLLAAFYWIVDVRGHTRWALPFVWIGLNPITIYLLSNVVDFDEVASRVVGGPVREGFDALSPGLGGVVISLTGIVLAIAVCWFMHRRRLYVRV